MFTINFSFMLTLMMAARRKKLCRVELSQIFHDFEETYMRHGKAEMEATFVGGELSDVAAEHFSRIEADLRNMDLPMRCRLLAMRYCKKNCDVTIMMEGITLEADRMIKKLEKQLMKERRADLANRVSRQLSKPYGIYNFSGTELDPAVERYFSSGFKNIELQQFKSKHEFIEHGKRELKQIMEAYTRRKSQEPVARVRVEKLTLTEFVMFLSTYLSPGSEARLLDFYITGLKKLRQLGRKLHFKSGRKIVAPQGVTILKADKEIGLAQVSMKWLHSELQRQLTLGSYQMVDRSEEAVLASVVADEQRMKADFTDREKKELARHYRVSKDQGRKLGVLRIQVISLFPFYCAWHGLKNIFVLF